MLDIYCILLFINFMNKMMLNVAFSQRNSNLLLLDNRFYSQNASRTLKDQITMSKYWKCKFCNKGRLITTSLLEDEANWTADKVIVISNNNHEYDCAPDQQRVLNHITQRELNERVMTNNHIPVVEHYEMVETL